MFTDDRTDPPEGEEIGMPPPSDGPVEPGWWQLIAGTWQWVTSPTPKVVSGS